MTPINIFIASNFLLLRNGIRAVLEQYPGKFRVVGQTNDLEALGRIEFIQTDVLLVDGDPFLEETLRRLEGFHCHHPSIRILLLTRSNETALLDRAVMAGVRGILQASTPSESLPQALESVHAGQLWLDREMADRVFLKLVSRTAGATPKRCDDKLDCLTARERTLLAYVSRHPGARAKMIARHMQLSEGTVRNYMSSIYEKLGVADGQELIVYTISHQIEKRLGEMLSPC